jgi:hypothetical protein
LRREDHILLPPGIPISFSNLRDFTPFALEIATGERRISECAANYWPRHTSNDGTAPRAWPLFRGIPAVE